MRRQEGRARKEILEAEPSELGGPSPGDGGTWWSPSAVQRQGWAGNRAPWLPGRQSPQFHRPMLVKA